MTGPPLHLAGSFALVLGALLVIPLALALVASYSNPHRTDPGGTTMLPSRSRLYTGLACLALAAVVGAIGWWKISGEQNLNRQVPLLASAGVAALLLAVAGGSLLVADQLRGDDRRLDDLENAVQQLAATLAPLIEAPARVDGRGTARRTAAPRGEPAYTPAPQPSPGSNGDAPSPSPTATLRSAAEPSARVAAPVVAKPAKAAEPVKPAKAAEPAKPAKPAKAAPTKAEPVKAEPVKAEPGKAEPVKAEPVKAEPVKAEPVKAAPVKAPSATPAAEKPAATKSAAAKPAKKAAAKKAAKKAPAKKAPAKKVAAKKPAKAATAPTAPPPAAGPATPAPAPDEAAVPGSPT